ncbi:MAG TPA: dihydrofolate reductase family protein [Polyangiales bacterium]
MAKLTITTFLTLDGVMQAPGGPSEDPSGGFAHGGWLVPHVDEGMMEFMASVFERAGAFLLGRFTYDTFAAHWPRVTDPNDPVATKLNALPKYMVSNTPQKLSWHNATQLTGDLNRTIAAIKGTTHKELQVHGSAGLAQTLIQHDLIDEYNLLTFPVVLGTGKRLFGTGAMPATMKLLSQRTTKNGISIATYARAGALQTGSFALDA